MTHERGGDGLEQGEARLYIRSGATDVLESGFVEAVKVERRIEQRRTEEGAGAGERESSKRDLSRGSAD